MEKICFVNRQNTNGFYVCRMFTFDEMHRRLPPMNIKYILFDLDNTLYPASSGFFEVMDRRMTEYVSGLLGIPFDEAFLIRKKYRKRYGTTIGGLIAENGLQDPEEYLDFIHPRDVENYLKKDDELREVLEAVDLPRSILTNSAREHAARVLQFLNIDDLFDEIFDIRFNSLKGKPSKQLYQKVLKRIEREAGEVLLVDDMPDYLRSFKELGGVVLLIRDGNHESTHDLPCKRNVKELPEYLSEMLGENTSEHQSL